MPQHSVFDKLGIIEHATENDLTDVKVAVSTIDDDIKKISWELQEMIDGHTKAPEVNTLIIALKEKLSKICERLY